jgi:hypothetical protein
MSLCSKIAVFWILFPQSTSKFTNEFMILTNNLGVICFFLWQFNMGDVLIGGESTGKRQYLPTFNFASILSY